MGKNQENKKKLATHDEAPDYGLNKFKKNAIIVLLTYFFLAITFFVLTGEQLHLRESRENIDILYPNSGTIELVEGSLVQQKFVNKIQRLKSISITWATYSRSNLGEVFIDLYDINSKEQIFSWTLSANEIREEESTYLPLEEPREDLVGVPLLITIKSNSEPGLGVTPLMNTSVKTEELELFFDGQKAIGTLCFAAQGDEFIWTGLNYWKFVAIGALLLIIYMLLIARRLKKGESVALLSAIMALKKYRFLITQLVSRDFKSKYKRSVLGVLWSFLNPLLTMFVQYLVFSNLFRFDIPYYPVYLLCGIVIFNYFTEACGMTLSSIVGNASLITKVYVPKYIYPLSRVLSSFNNLLISMIPLFLVAFASGLYPSKALLLLPFVLCCLALFCLGFGMLLSVLMVFFRDTHFLWGIFSMIWMYLTPIFYPESILPPSVSSLLKINPMYYYIKFVRTCVMEGISPEPIMYLQCFLFAMGTFLIGAFVFKKTQDSFVLYL